MAALTSVEAAVHELSIFLPYFVPVASPEMLSIRVKHSPELARALRIRLSPSILAETVVALQALFAGQTVSTAGPHVRLHNHVLAPAPLQSPPPLLIGGNGTRLLGLAAQHANIVSFTGFSPDPGGSNVRTHFSRAGLADRVRLVQQGVRAANRPVAPELNVLLQSLIITDDRDYLAQTMAMRHNQSPMELLSCPFLAFGTVEEICGQLLRQHDEHAITYITMFNQHADDAAQVIAALDELAVDSDTDPAGNPGS